MKRTQTNTNSALIQAGALRLLINGQTLYRTPVKPSNCFGFQTPVKSTCRRTGFQTLKKKKRGTCLCDKSVIPSG